jgi:glycosyltransferase involved in cell wall biosynthesis
MKILWVNPWFGNYRVPVYEELYKLSNGNFYLIIDGEWVDASIIEKLKIILGDNFNAVKNYSIINFSISRGNLESNMANTGIKIPWYKDLYKQIKATTPDIIIADGFFQLTPWALAYSVIHKIPLVIDYERTQYVERNSPKWRTFYRKMIGRIVSGFVINGSLTYQYLCSLGFSNKPIQEGCMAADSYNLSEKVTKISIDEKTTLKNELSLGKGLVFLFVGQIVLRKGVNELLRAWEEYSHLHPEDNLLLVGSGPLLDDLKTKYNTYNNIKFLGSVCYDEIYKYYSIADIFVMPTLEDNWSLVVPEAMACGLPIACSIYNGCYPELVKENENGFLFDPFKKESIINSLDSFHYIDLKNYGEKSSLIEKQFTPDKAAKRIYEFCKDLI